MELDEDTLAVLAKVAGVSLTAAERKALAPRLQELLGDADKVNAFMALRRAVGPGVRFRHFEPQDGGDA